MIIRGRAVRSFVTVTGELSSRTLLAEQRLKPGNQIPSVALHLFSAGSMAQGWQWGWELDEDFAYDAEKKSWGRETGVGGRGRRKNPNSPFPRITEMLLLKGPGWQEGPFGGWGGFWWLAGSVLLWWHPDSEDAAGCSCSPASPRQAPRTGGPVWERNAPGSQDQPVLPASCPAACPHPEEGHLGTARFGVTSLSPVTVWRGVYKGTASAGFSQWGRHRDGGQGGHSAGERGAPVLLFAERELVAGTRGGGAFGGDGSRRKRAGSTPGAGIWVEAESGRSWQRCGPPPGQHSLFLPAPPWKWFSSQLRPA